MSDQQLNTAPKGIPGKWFALPFGMVLLFAVWLVVSMAFRFQAIMRQLESTREAWPKAAVVIRSFLDESAQASGATSLADASSVENANKSASWGELYSKFSKSSIFDEQSVAADGLLKLSDATGNERTPLQSLVAHDTLKAVFESERKRTQLQSGIVGWCTVKGLRLKLPPLFVMD